MKMGGGENSTSLPFCLPLWFQVNGIEKLTRSLGEKGEVFIERGKEVSFEVGEKGRH